MHSSTKVLIAQLYFSLGSSSKYGAKFGFDTPDAPVE